MTPPLVLAAQEETPEGKKEPIVLQAWLQGEGQEEHEDKTDCQRQITEWSEVWGPARN
jgi:hypothetical protein